MEMAFQNYFQPQMGYYPQQMPQAQIQSGGFVQVHNEMEARNYPVAPGNSVTFIDETAPYCYTKTMGFSQFDRPRFEKYRLVKEEDAPQQTVAAAAPVGPDLSAYATKAELEALRAQIENAIKAVTTKEDKAND